MSMLAPGVYRLRGPLKLAEGEVTTPVEEPAGADWAPADLARTACCRIPSRYAFAALVVLAASAPPLAGCGLFADCAGCTRAGWVCCVAWPEPIPPCCGWEAFCCPT